jgi:hypothetical protein
MKGRPGPTTALGGSNPLKLLILYNESKHNILAYQGKANKHYEFPSLSPRHNSSILDIKNEVKMQSDKVHNR